MRFAESSILRDLKDMLALGRFRFLLGGFLLFSMGALIASSTDGRFYPFRFLFGYAVFFPAHLSVSYSNDVFDVSADSFNEPSLFSGGSGVLKRRPELRRAAMVVALTLIVISLALSIAFANIYSMGPMFVIYVAAGAFLGWAYTGPPFRLSYRGLGEVCTAATIGLLVPFLGYWTMAGMIDFELLPLAPALLLYGLAFILNVQIPDVEGDIKGGKNSLVAIIGRRMAFRAVFLASLSATIYFISILYLDLGPGEVDLLPFALASFLPAIISAPSAFVPTEERRKATFQAATNLLSDFVFLGAVDLAMLITL